MSDRKYTLPGMADWTFKVSDYGNMLWHKGGAGIKVFTATSAQEIADEIQKILRGATSAPMEAAAQAALLIDWQAMLKPAGALVAPLLNAGPAAGLALTTELIDELCEHLKAVYFPLQKLKG